MIAVKIKSARDNIFASMNNDRTRGYNLRDVE